MLYYLKILTCNIKINIFFQQNHIATISRDLYLLTFALNQHESLCIKNINIYFSKKKNKKKQTNMERQNIECIFTHSNINIDEADTFIQAYQLFTLILIPLPP